MIHVIDRLVRAVREKGSVVCVGIDPSFELLPDHLKNQAEKRASKEAVAEAFFTFGARIIDATHDLAAACKLNIAFYEKYGKAGVEVFEKLVAYAHAKELIVVEDGKRGDIGHTSKAYADGHLGEIEVSETGRVRGFDVDLITINPYLGSDGLDPFFACGKDGKGVFVLARTSNPSAQEVQDRLVHIGPAEEEFFASRIAGTSLTLQDLPVMRQLSIAAGVAPLYAILAKLIDEWGAPYVGDEGYSAVGAVVGATYPGEARVLRRLTPKTWWLVPGYGKQGGGAQDVVPCFNEDGLGAIVNSSRGIMSAYRTSKQYSKPEMFADAAREAVLAMRDAINAAIRI